MNLLVKGAGKFLQENVATPIVLDNLFRFMSWIYFSLGLLVAFVIYLPKINHLVYFIGIVVIFSGLGRFYSCTKVGSGGKFLDTIMVIEILLGISIILLEYFK